MEGSNWIADHLTLNKDGEGILFRCRLILSELITNAIKHSLVDNIIMEITVDPLFVEISRYDRGKRFFLVLENQSEYYPLNDAYAGQQIMVFKDKMYNLVAVVKNPFLIDFKLQEYMEEKHDIKDTLEHFGLIILTKSSSRFSYRFDPDTFTNIFSARIETT
ncbi:MAG: hypothetical protein ACOH2A_12265 [Sphingobacteriaceae bacterium]